MPLFEPPPDVSQSRRGQWGMPGPGDVPASNLALLGLVLFVVRWVPTQSRAIVSGSLDVSVAALSNDPVDIGLYSAAGTLLSSSGSTAGKLNAVGRSTLPLAAAVPVARGVPVYSAVLCTVATTAATVAAVLRAPVNDTWKAGADGTTSDPGSREIAFASVASAVLPASLPVLTGLTLAPAVAWRTYS